MTTPIIGAPDWAASQASPWATVNQATRMIEALARYGIIEDRDLTAPPGSCADGACYLVKATATGAWAGQDGKMAIAVGANAASGWYFVTVAVEGVELYVRDENVKIRYNGSAWTSASGGEFHFVVAVSDESTALTAGTAKITFEWPVAVALTNVYGFVSGASDSSGEVIVDVNDDGVSIFSTTLSIDPAERSSRTALVPPVLTSNPLTIAAGSIMTIDIVQAGDNATGLKLTFIGTLA